MIFCIHHNDLDGRCSAAIVKYANTGEEIYFIEADYNLDLKPSINDMFPYDTVYIVDFSLKPEDMMLLIPRVKKVIWIDHHVTAKEYPYQALPGLRNFDDKAEAGCELTWRYFFPDQISPLAVRLIGDYDKWALIMQPECFEFYEGMKLFKHEPTSDLWPSLFLSNEEARSIVDSGQAAILYRDNYCNDMCRSYGYEAEFAGHLAYAANMFRFGSKQFGHRFSQYPFCIAYVHDGEKYIVSLYSEQVDVGAICKAHGGGGHKGAAGFTCKELPFKKVCA